VLFTRSEIELLQELSKRRKELDAREQTVIQREGWLNAAETRIEKKIAELKGVKDDIEKLIQQYEEQEEQQLNDLVAIYEKMKPKDASRIFNDLETDILLQIFDKMKASKTALILANMKAARAKEITSRIAERREMPNIN
jgi:flagellar motility protein MotE (MotC chaperone)